MLLKDKLPYKFFYNSQLITIKKQIYSGTNSTVFSCVYGGKDYIIKFFKGKKERYERFKLEVEKIDKINEKISEFTPKIILKNIVDYKRDFLYNVKNERSPFFLMEKGDRFDFKKLTFSKKIDTLIEIAESLKKLHSVDIQHRDIKIDNLVYYNGKITFIDFSTAKVLDFKTVDPTEKMGSIATMAPEMYNHASDIPDYKFEYADIYSFGKIMWTILKDDPLSVKFTTYNSDDFQCKIILDEINEGIVVLLEELIHDATLSDYYRRITLDEILRSLELIRDVLIYNPEECNVIKFIYYLKNIYEKKYDSIIIESYEKIINFLSNISNVGITLSLSIDGKNICEDLITKNFSINYDNYAYFILENGIKYLFEIKNIVITSEEIIINTVEIQDAYKSNFGASLKDIGDFFRRSILSGIIDDNIKEIYLDCEIHLKKYKKFI